MDSSRKSEVAKGVVLPLVVLVVVLALGIVTGEQDVFITMMVAVPWMSAVFASVTFTAVVAALTLVAAVVLGVLPGDQPFQDGVIPIVAVVMFGAIAVIASRFRVGDAAKAPHLEKRKAMQFQLQTQADTDSMTGLLNRRGAIRAMGPRNADGERVIAFLDCDLFKQVNEKYGSDVGDEFLQAIAGRLRHSLPAHDTVARWDGDEFLLAVAASAETAGPALERVVGSINGHPIRTTAGPIPATVSVGAALWAPGQELEDAISRAGRALYGAKSGGRGRVVLDAAPSATPASDGEAAGRTEPAESA